MLCKSQDRKSLNSSMGCIQLSYIKSFDMLNKNTPGVKKAKQSRKYQVALIRTLD